MNIDNPLVNSQSPRIIVTFPTTTTLDSTCSFSNVSGQLSTTLTCTASTASNTYTLDSPFGSNDYPDCKF